MHDRFGDNNDDGTFLKNRRFYKAKAGTNFDCAWGGKNEFEPNSSFELIGEEIHDTADGEDLDYTPSGPPDADSDVFLWSFFPHVNHPNVKASSDEGLGYGYTSDAFPLEGGDLPWDEFVHGGVFSNSINTIWGFDENYINDYDDGAFYFVFLNYGDRCDNHQSGNFSLNRAMVVYTIPKKEVYDYWNGYKPICFVWGDDYTCESDDIVISKDIPDVAENDNGARNYYGFKSRSVKIRFIPPRYFYENDEKADSFRPVNNTEPNIHLKNPIEKDPINPYFSQLTPCAFTNEQVLDPITNETFTCISSAFYPYVSEQVPFLFSPSNTVDFTGNLVGLTDGTRGYERDDDVITDYTTDSTPSNVYKEILGQYLMHGLGMII